MNFINMHTRSGTEITINMDHVLKIVPAPKLTNNRYRVDYIVKGLDPNPKEDVDDNTILIFTNGGEFIVKESYEEVKTLIFKHIRSGYTVVTT